ncbi:SGNH/GDSL hydrolase family protein [Sphingobium sp. H39-3-25]|uniref:SGNH/GDSL hydrolase family protein n=1 Tax=Sphingobium arseniciresistens TaxID=3030834 RepID=UPI0023B9F953|nr:SGNH/GDSL hydrolase family protein [Sphingobium arseniciresistens]
MAFFSPFVRRVPTSQDTILRDKAASMLTSAATGSDPVASTASVAITLSAGSTASTIANGVLVAPQDSVFTYLGSQMEPGDVFTTGASWNSYVGAMTTLKGWSRKSYTGGFGGPYRVVFGYGGRYLDVNLMGSGVVRIWVDGRPLAVAPRTDLTGFSPRQYILDFATYARRTIEVEVGGQINFGGVKRERDYNLWTVENRGLRVAHIGDSFSEGGNNGNNALQTCAGQAAAYLGVKDYWNVGEGSTGFMTNGNQSGKKYQEKFATDVQPYNPDWIVVCAGITDAGQNATTVQTLATAYYQNMLAALPNAIVTVVGPWRAPGLNPSQGIFDAMRNAVAAQTSAVAARRIMYFDTLAENVQQIAGRVGAVSGAGNSNVYIGADNIHPVVEGDDYLGRYVANCVIRHANAIVKAPR